MDKPLEDIVLCCECKHKPKLQGGRVVLPIENGQFDEHCPFVCSEWKLSKIPKYDDYCSRGERKVDN